MIILLLFYRIPFYYQKFFVLDVVLESSYSQFSLAQGLGVRAKLFKNDSLSLVLIFPNISCFPANQIIFLRIRPLTLSSKLSIGADGGNELFVRSDISGLSISIRSSILFLALYFCLHPLLQNLFAVPLVFFAPCLFSTMISSRDILSLFSSDICNQIDLNYQILKIINLQHILFQSLNYLKKHDIVRYNL